MCLAWTSFLAVCAMLQGQLLLLLLMRVKCAELEVIIMDGSRTVHNDRHLIFVITNLRIGTDVTSGNNGDDSGDCPETATVDDVPP